MPLRTSMARPPSMWALTDNNEVEEFDLKDYALTHFDGSPAVYVGTYHKYKFRRNDNCNQHRTTANISSNAVI